MREVVDDVEETVRLDGPPRRIVSLVPSTTETLFDLGLDEQVIGVTRFCVRPAAAADRSTIGGTKDVDVDKVLALAPDLVVANREENLPEAVEALRDHVPVYVAAPETVQDALSDLTRLAYLLHAEGSAAAWIHTIQEGLDNLAPWRDEPMRCLAFIWREPWMAVGYDTFASSVMAAAGWSNILHDRPRYPTLDLSEVAALAPEQILLPSEPFPFRASHRDELVRAGIPLARIGGIDGQHLTWHGTRLARALPALLRARRDGLAPLEAR